VLNEVAAISNSRRRHDLKAPEDRAALARHLERAGFTRGVIAETLRGLRSASQTRR
jgi:hypothetical protein